MNGSTLRQCASTAALGALLVWLPCFEAIGADASSWDGDARSAARLVTAGAASAKVASAKDAKDKDDALRAGIEIRLAPGWKTYWRYPGDSGVPPAFDFSKSQNVKSVSVLWPAPHRFVDDSGNSIGYKAGVMLPLRVVPDNPKQPVTLNLSLDYAICEKLCIPAKAASKIVLTRTSTSNDSVLAAAEAQVPKPRRVGEVSPFGIAAVRREPGGAHPRIVVDVIAPSSAPLDLFAEGPTDDWALPLPEPVPGSPAGVRRFAFELDGAPPGANAIGVPLRFTLVSGENAIEVTTIPE